MALSKRYNPRTAEPKQQAIWQTSGTYHFSKKGNRQVFAIDTPPPTVSGKLHLGHVYSYSHIDFMARYWRMNGWNVLYPMGFDDNGLPTERLVEQQLGVSAKEVGRQAFIEHCLAVGEEAEKAYAALWRRLGLSIDWRFTYRTIDEESKRLSQISFIDLFRQGLAFRKQAPTIWCPECQTAIAQAELKDLERESQFLTLRFTLEDGQVLPVATTRPELLSACVALFVHPDDPRYEAYVGRKIQVPLFGQWVSILADEKAETEKGTGAVMCCTFGDVTDVAWWHQYELDLIEAIGRDGHMMSPAGQFAGMIVADARLATKAALEEDGYILDDRATDQTIRVHERCDTPVEYIVSKQWFVRVLDFKEELLNLGDHIRWHPDYMRIRYRQWVENLGWDWCISRQRAFGVPIPAWSCESCGRILVPNKADLPIDPVASEPRVTCSCDNPRLIPETDVMDTWATSSLSPQMVAGWLGQSGFDGQDFKAVSLRPQAHDIIRTWAFYSIVKSHHHFGEIPWYATAISGWALAPDGVEKISKSRGGGPFSPEDMIEKYSADALRYWAASTGLGKDAIINEEKMASGAKLVNKLWNVGRFCQRFLTDYKLPELVPELTTADRWLLSNLNRLIGQVTDAFEKYEYAQAKNRTEIFFWNDLADNYLEMAKQRLYDPGSSGHEGACYTMYQALSTSLKLFAPFLPHVTDEIYRGLFAFNEPELNSIHLARWPGGDVAWSDPAAAEAGEGLIAIASAVRRFQSDSKLSLGAPIGALHLEINDEKLKAELMESGNDILSVTRARSLTFGAFSDGEAALLLDDGIIRLSLSTEPS